MKSITLVVLIAALAGGGYFLFADQGHDATTTGTEGTGVDINATGPTAASADLESGSNPGTGGNEDPIREVAPPPVKDYPQGLEGQVISSGGGTVRDAEVYLLYGVAPQDMISQLQMFAQNGGRMRAKIAAQTKTDASGRFRLPSPVTEGAAAFHLRVKAKGHQVYGQELRVQPEHWQNLKMITLLRGKRLEGVVRDKTTKNPISSATVRIKLPHSGNVVITPGLEDGVEAQSDEVGRYRVEGLPDGPLELSAFARGYGLHRESNIVFEKTQQIRVLDVELAKGFEIEGWITDGDGEPIARARVEAQPFSQTNPTIGHAWSDDDGRFAIFGLAKGQYIVSAQAPGYVKGEKKPVAAGAKDLQIVIEKQGSITVRVTTKGGRPLSGYRVEVKRFFPENPKQYGRTGIPASEVRAAKNGETEIGGIDPGSYVVQVDAVGFAKTFSDHFTIAEGQSAPVSVTVTMNVGATLYGTITDESGAPVVGATVQTLDNSYQDNPLMDIFGALMPVSITKKNVNTNSKGRFVIKLLTPAEYQLKISHPEFPWSYARGFKLADGQKLDAGTIRLKAGIRVHGRVFYQGAPIAAAEVSVSSVGGEGVAPVFAKAFSNEKGEFKLDRVLPEGAYEVQATRTDHQNPFMKLADIQNSRQAVRVVRGMPPVIIRIKTK